MKTLIFAIMLLSLALNSNAQMRNNNWCFGHYAGIHFDSQNIPTTFNSPVISKASCASISDSIGQLLFSIAYDTACCSLGFTQWLAAKVYDSSGNIMQNGDSLFGDHWYQHLVITPNPSNEHKYYAFSGSVINFEGLYYSEIDMSLNNGLGAVTQRNIQLDTLVGNDCLTAVKHGNGRDWWLIFRSALIPDTNDNFYLYLIDSNGINPPIVEHAGAINVGSLGTIIFNASGNQFIRCAHYGLIELFNFNRCTGTISSNKIIEYAAWNSNPYHYYFFSAFSPSGRYLYVAETDYTTYLHQYDLQAPNIKASRITIDSSAYPPYSGGWLKLAPDSNIYWSKLFYDTVGISPYPYPDTLYNLYNSYLSVINDPDSAGLKCNFTPYSFYLGGNRTYWGLPNNPDYDLPGDSGCIVASMPHNTPKPPLGGLTLTYIAAWEKLFVNANNIKGKNVTVSIYDGRGSLKFEVISLKSNAGYFTIDVNCAGWSDGLYVVHLQTEKEVLSKKFIKE